MNEDLKRLAKLYKESTKITQKEKILNEIITEKKSLSDFLGLIDEARNRNLDLEFSKAIIDNFFATLNLDTNDLVIFYQRVKARVFESYFIGNLYRKNINFKTLELFYLRYKEQDKSLAKILVQIMVTTAFSVDHFLSILCCEELDKNLELDFLVEVKKQNGCMAFWVKAYERAKPNSALMLYADNLLRKKMAARPFTSAYDFYMEHLEARVAPVLLEAIADMAQTEQELDKVIYLAPKNSKIFMIAAQKKEKIA